jgi:hypothetical protein
MLERLYAVTATLLILHEIDSAYWREWEVLGLPGGETAFLAMHLPLLLGLLWGHAQVLAGRRAGAWTSLALASAGVGAFAIHSALLLRGGAAFRTAASIVLLVTTAAVSMGLALAGIRVLRRGRGPDGA